MDRLKKIKYKFIEINKKKNLFLHLLKNGGKKRFLNVITLQN